MFIRNRLGFFSFLPEDFLTFGFSCVDPVGGEGVEPGGGKVGSEEAGGGEGETISISKAEFEKIKLSASKADSVANQNRKLLEEKRTAVQKATGLEQALKSVELDPASENFQEELRNIVAKAKSSQAGEGGADVAALKQQVAALELDARVTKNLLSTAQTEKTQWEAKYESLSSEVRDTTIQGGFVSAFQKAGIQNPDDVFLLLKAKNKGTFSVTESENGKKEFLFEQTGGEGMYNPTALARSILEDPAWTPYHPRKTIGGTDTRPADSSSGRTLAGNIFIEGNFNLTNASALIKTDKPRAKQLFAAAKASGKLAKGAASLAGFLSS
jgi:hypothetical protein